MKLLEKETCFHILRVRLQDKDRMKPEHQKGPLESMYVRTVVLTIKCGFLPLLTKAKPINEKKRKRKKDLYKRNQFVEITPFQTALPVFFVDLVSKAHGVNDSEFEAHVTLLQFIGVGLERDSRLVVLGGLTLKLGVEQRVHQGGLPQTRLA